MARSTVRRTPPRRQILLRAPGQVVMVSTLNGDSSAKSVTRALCGKSRNGRFEALHWRWLFGRSHRGLRCRFMARLPEISIPTVPVAGLEERYPVRRVYCVGRNYAAHAREMGSDPEREPPFFFSKPPDALVPSESTVAYPPRTSDLHHEIELVVALGDFGDAPAAGRDVSRERASELIYGYAVGLDLTRRDLQSEAKKGRATVGHGQGIRRLGAHGAHPSRRAGRSSDRG